MLDAGEVDGLIVSASAVEHLGYQDRVTEIFTTEVLVPAAGQGACVIQARQGSKDLIKMAKHLDHRTARASLECERAFLRELKAGPTLPVGALAEFEGPALRLEAVVADRDGRKVFREVESGRAGDEEPVGVRLARRLLLDGARRLLEGAGSH
jgi:hydroxymethylbilane synthase